MFVRDSLDGTVNLPAGGFHAQYHVREVVETVKYTEYIHAVLLRHLTEPGERGRERKREEERGRKKKREEERERDR